jgi:ribonuclease HI
MAARARTARNFSAVSVSRPTTHGLTAPIEALASLKQPCAVTIVTDSQYLRNGIATWIRLKARLEDRPSR